MAEGKKGLSKGCMVALIIVSAIVILVVALSIVCYIKRDSLVEWGVVQITDRTSQLILADPPDSISTDEIKKLVSDFKDDIKVKKISTAQMQDLVLMFQDFLKDNKIDKDEGKKFVEELRRLTADTLVLPAQ